jgi:pyruvate dehydrogenase E1 component alpha subunit
LPRRSTRRPEPRPTNAADFAEASPYPTAADIQTDVYWEADHPAERKSQGRLFFD